MSEWQKLLTDKRENDITKTHTCFCVGPQNGEPLCPCAMRMRGVCKRGDRWVEPEHDLGPVREVVTEQECDK